MTLDKVIRLVIDVVLVFLVDPILDGYINAPERTNNILISLRTSGRFTGSVLDAHFPL